MTEEQQAPLVLVVDDDPTILELLERALVRRGFRVQTQTSGFGVVGRAAGTGGEQPALLIIDQMMPALSGASLIELLGKNPKASKVPVILFTALDRREVGPLDAHALARYQSKGSIKALLDTIDELLEAAVTDPLP